MQRKIRKSGGAAIIALPKAICEVLDWDIGTEVKLKIVDGQLVISDLNETYKEWLERRKNKPTLNELIEQCGEPVTPDDPSFEISKEDQEWLDMKPVGKEWGAKNGD